MTGYDFYRRLWGPAALAVTAMEARGLGLCTFSCDVGAAQCRQEIAGIEEQLNTWAGTEVKWGSPKQVAEFFYDVKGWQVPTECGSVRAVKLVKDGKRPADEVACHRLAESVPEQVDREHLRLYAGWRDQPAKADTPAWKILTKRAQFYEGLPKHVASDGRIHPQLGASTETGRLSSRNPNLQNQPASVRWVFVPKKGYSLMAYDYSGLEWRILAHILAARYQDFSLVDDIKAGIDPHSATAKRMYGLECDVGDVKALHPEERAAAKIINYSVNYGKTAVGLAIQLGITVEAAEQLLAAFYGTNPGIRQWHWDAVDLARNTGYSRTLLGRYRFLDDIRARNSYVRQKAERLALNTPIQGSAADIVAAAMVACSEEFNPVLRKMGVRQVLQIHDELLFEVPQGLEEEAGAEVETRMVSALEPHREFLCPLAVDGAWGPNWMECK